MKRLLIGLLALGSISAFANSDCVDEVMIQISDIPQVAETFSKLDKAFEVTSKPLNVSAQAQFDAYKEVRNINIKIRAVAEQACSNKSFEP